MNSHHFSPVHFPFKICAIVGISNSGVYSHGTALFLHSALLLKIENSQIHKRYLLKCSKDVQSVIQMSKSKGTEYQFCT